MSNLSPNAEIMLLVMAANGGEMDKGDLFRECERVSNMSPDEQAQWRKLIMPLVKKYAEERGRRCVYCGKPGGPSHLIQVNKQMKAFYVHRQCYRKLVEKIGDK